MLGGIWVQVRVWREEGCCERRKVSVEYVKNVGGYCFGRGGRVEVRVKCCWGGGACIVCVFEGGDKMGWGDLRVWVFVGVPCAVL